MISQRSASHLRSATKGSDNRIPYLGGGFSEPPATVRQDFFFRVSDHASKLSIDYRCEELCDLVEKLFKICPFDSALSLVKDSSRAVVNRMCVCSTTRNSQYFLVVYFHDQMNINSRGIAVLGFVDG